jgi:hypothetical protein
MNTRLRGVVMNDDLLAELKLKIDKLRPRIDDETATDAESDEFCALVNQYLAIAPPLPPRLVAIIDGMTDLEFGHGEKGSDRVVPNEDD